MSIRCATLILGVVFPCCIFAPSASAQEIPVVVGATVRLYTGDTSPVEGVVSEVDAGHISLRRASGQGYVSVPAEDVQRVEVGQETRSGAVGGMFLGGVIGYVVGLSVSSPDRWETRCGPFFNATVCSDHKVSGRDATIGAGLLGAALGAVVGHVIYNRKWVEIWEDPSPSVAVRPWLERGAGVRVSLPLAFDR